MSMPKYLILDKIYTILPYFLLIILIATITLNYYNPNLSQKLLGNKEEIMKEEIKTKKMNAISSEMADFKKEDKISVNCQIICFKYRLEIQGINLETKRNTIRKEPSMFLATKNPSIIIPKLKVHSK